MRIVAVTTSFPRHAGDMAGRCVHDLHAALREAGQEVLTLCPGADGVADEEETEAGRVIRVPYGPPGEQDLFYGHGLEENWRRTRRRLRKLLAFRAAARTALLEHGRTASLLLAHWIWPTGLPVVLASRALGIGAFGIGHGGDLHHLGRPFLGPLLGLRLRRGFDGILCTSESGAAIARARFPGTLVRVAPMGVDPSRFEHQLPPHPGWPPDYLLGLGRLTPLKGFDLLIRAGGRLRMPVVLAGEGPSAAALQELAAREGALVHFAGPLDAPGVVRALQHARCLVVPSRQLANGRTEGFPVVVLEALLAKTPVCASAVGGLPDLLPAEALVPPGSIEHLVERLRSLGGTTATLPCGEALTRGGTARALLSLVGDAAAPPGQSRWGQRGGRTSSAESLLIPPSSNTQ